ncbi:MAG: hypothetical protein EBZ49_03680 [Proteobacteria bacterium]|nr:hypothetical protein [Pseudomonadota bacterium]
MMLKPRIHKWGVVKIRTDFLFPPSPIRKYDWIAWEDGQEEGIVGEGATEEAAIADFKENYIMEYN